MKKNKDYKAEWRSRGLCINCGMARPDGWDKPLCQRCREQVLASKRRQRARKKAEGKCPQCGKPKGDWSLVKCKLCTDRTEGRRAKLRDERRGKNVCTECGKPIADRKRLCLEHTRAYKDHRERLAAKRLRESKCRDCGVHEPRPGKRTCLDCHWDNRRSTARIRQQRKDAGLCAECGKRPPTAGLFSCWECRQINIRHARKRRDEAFAAYGGPICVCCGETIQEFLQIDHVNNDGNVQRKMYPESRNLCAWLKKRGYPPGYQVLCANCNLAKARCGVCPHEKMRAKDAVSGSKSNS